MPARDDYILRFIDLLRQAIAQSLKLRQEGRFDQALFTLMVAQEKLFARQAHEFLHLPIEEQLHLLTIGESKEGARTRALAYAALLREAGQIYEAKDRADLAVGAFQLALYVTLKTSSTYGPQDDGWVPAAQELLAKIPADQLQEPVRALLEARGDSA
jgi:hypothetical protein